MTGQNSTRVCHVLRGLATNCWFGTITDEIICNQLVNKTIHAEVRNRPLLELELPLESALAITSKVQRAMKEAKVFTKDAGLSFQVAKIQAQKKPIVRGKTPNQRSSSIYCRSGSMCHMADYPKRPARNQACRKWKIGHFAFVCKQTVLTGSQVPSIEQTEI